jgi:hypothetical protein
MLHQHHLLSLTIHVQIRPGLFSTKAFDRTAYPALQRLVSLTSFVPLLLQYEQECPELLLHLHSVQHLRFLSQKDAVLYCVNSVAILRKPFSESTHQKSSQVEKRSRDFEIPVGINIHFLPIH